MNGFNDVQVRVVGPVIYISGQVTAQADKTRATNVALSIYPNEQVENIIWVRPSSIF